MVNSQKELCLTLVQALQHAGSYALGRQGKVRIEDKGKRDTVTEIDRENGMMIREALLQVDPEISFLGEDTAEHKGNNNILAIVDPLDATTNYALGRREFSIMGAIFEGKQPRFGVIHIPSFHETFTAEIGNGAFLNGNPIRVSEVEDLAKAVISCNRSNYPTEADVEIGLAIIKGLARYAKSWRNFGTAGFEYADVACGRLDGIITPIAEEVHAAGYIIMQEAGAKVTDENGNPFSLGSKMIVAANPKIHETLLKLIRNVLATVSRT